MTRIIITWGLLLLSIIAFGQRSDGFFVQEYCFVDPNLLKALKVDKIEILVKENNRKAGSIEIFLDSNQRMIKQMVDYADSIRTELFESATISQFACPIVRPDYIKSCEMGRITKTESGGAYRMTTFDAAGKVIADRWKPGKSLLEMNRRFIYRQDNLMDTITVADINNEGSIDKKELHLYRYADDRLVSISQLISSGNGFQPAGSFTFKNFDCGLVKRMEGNAYFKIYKVKVDFKYYSKGKVLK